MTATAAALLTLAVSHAGAAPKKRCSAIVSASECVNVKRAPDNRVDQRAPDKSVAEMRENAVAQTQPRMSYTAPARAPARDRTIYVQKNQREMNNIFLPPRTLRNIAVKP